MAERTADGVSTKRLDGRPPRKTGGTRGKGPEEKGPGECSPLLATCDSAYKGKSKLFTRAR